MTPHADRFLQPATIAFDQASFDGAAPAGHVAHAVAAARTAIVRGADPATPGQASILPHRVDSMPVDLIGRDFGAASRRSSRPHVEPAATYSIETVSSYVALRACRRPG